ncbi:zinc ribbon domain-containing protein [Myxococcota bacterium]|nr:zinc ribbon domain-containing protein [Myxococcota bacterium]
MSQVTRIAYSDDLTVSKYKRLEELARRLGLLRSEVWQQFGSLKGVGTNHREVRDQWLKEQREFDVPARLWKETLRDVFKDIQAYRESAKVKVRAALQKRDIPSEEKKRLFDLLASPRWTEDNYLRRLMRRHYKHGHTRVRNQIILDPCCYKAFVDRGRAWIEMMSLESRQRLAIPLSTNRAPSGTLRLILRGGRVELHYAVEEERVCSVRPCGSLVVGLDKGYSEVFTDSDGQRHGLGFGDLLTKESDGLKEKYQRRNKLSAIAEKKPHKRDRIRKFNLGRKKLDERQRKHRAKVESVIYRAVHDVVDKAGTIAAEDLSFVSKSRSLGASQNRRLSGWVKGLMGRALYAVSRRRGASVCLVSCAYTSQMDSRYGILLGTRKGDSFYCFDGVVLDADINAARNILARLEEPEIRLFMPYPQVKELLQERTEQFLKRLRLSNQDSSCISIPRSDGASTESELPLVDQK